MACAHGESVTFAAPRKSPDFRWVAGGLATRALVSTTGAEEGRRATRGKRQWRPVFWLPVWMLLVLVGCHDRQSETALQLWAMGREGEVVQRLVPEFERAHPGVRVRVQQIPWSAAHEKLLTAYVGDAMPDVFQVGNTWIPEFVALGALEPLDERLARSTAVARDDYFPGILDANVDRRRDLRACRGTSTRACSSIAPICSRAAGYRRAAAHAGTTGSRR